ncbi:thiol-disulfide isomerase/thioredoxin [Pedobacter sp. UYEF25]
MKIKTLLYLLLATSLSQNLYAQIQTNNETKIKNTFILNGTWRGVFTIKTGVEVPFNFEIDAKNTAQQHITFLNAEERFDGGIVQQTTDSVFVKLSQFDNELAFKIQGDSLVGSFRKQDGSGKSMPVTATKNVSYRFKPSGKMPEANFSGTYEVTFKSTAGKDENAVGIFKQNGNKITGTFLRVSGDARYLEGLVEGNSFYLSSFIGLNPYYYKGTFSKDGTITGEVVRAIGNTGFSGKQNQNAALPDVNKLTFLKDGYKTLNFSFPEVNGKQISLSDKKFKNKVVILTITGTWCPNCMDEASFIAPWYVKNRDRGVEVISLHYERKLDSAYVRTALTRFREKYAIEYDQVIAGTANVESVNKTLPALNNFSSFPTTIILNKKGEVAQIHTGYSGPATGKHYTDFVKEFNEEIDTLLAQ